MDELKISLESGKYFKILADSEIKSNRICKILNHHFVISLDWGRFIRLNRSYSSVNRYRLSN